MISAILAKLSASLFKTISYSRFVGLAVSCLDINCCLFSGLKLTVLVSSAPRLFMVEAEDQWIFMICLISRLVVILLIFWLVLEKQSAAWYKLDTYRFSAYLIPLVLFALMRWAAPESSLVFQTALFDVGIIGLCYTFVLLSARLCYHFKN